MSNPVKFLIYQLIDGELHGAENVEKEDAIFDMYDAEHLALTGKRISSLPECLATILFFCQLTLSTPELE